MLRGAGYTVVSADSPSLAIRAVERSRPAAIVIEPGTLTPATTENLVALAAAKEIPVVREWSGLESLVAKIERVLGKPDATSRAEAHIIVGPLVVDLTGHEARIDGLPLGLTAREFELLCHLARHPGWVYSRQELLEQVWGYEFGDPRVVTVHMGNLRKKVDAAAPGCGLIETVRNVGYKLVVPVAGGATAHEANAGSGAGGIRGSTAIPVAGAPVGATPSSPSAPSPPGEERRLVTVLFAHLGGLAALAETLDLESVSGLVGELCDVLSARVKDYGGRLERLGPDAFVAVFGAPIAHDNDSEMALRAGLDVKEAVMAFAAEKGLQGLSIHIGINTGGAIAGSFGSGIGQYSVMGEPLDGAACLAGIAGPGEILAGLETVRVAAGLLESEPAGTVKVRGRAEELVYERVQGIKTHREPSLGGRGIESILVGREEQLTRFRACLDRLDEGVGGALFVIGEAGVGKSRLVAEVRREAAERGLRWLEARTLPYGRNISYFPFQQIVQADCGIQPGDSVPVREQKLRDRLQRLFADEAGDFLPVLGNLLGIPPAESEGREPSLSEDENLRRSLNDVAARYATRLSTEQPTVFVFEDVHWLDKSSAALLQNLLPLNAEAPMLGCFVGRGDPDSVTLELLETAQRTEGLTCVDIQLQRLSRRETQRLVRNLLGGARVDQQVMHAIESRSEGNPLFVEEIVRHLIDSGSLERDGQGNWRVVKAGGDLTIPSTIQGVLAARIDRLPEEPRQELLRASIIGRSFYRELLSDISASAADDFDRSLTLLQDHQLIFVRQQEPELEYAFKHVLVQEAAYGIMLPKQRKELHRRVARAIEERYADRIKGLYGILAYHYSRAEDWRNAQEYLLKGGNQSVSLAADAEGVAQYREAMAALLRAFDATWDRPDSPDQVMWFVRATEPFWLARCLGDLLDSAEVFYQKILAACGPEDPRTLAATTVLAGCYWQRGMYDQATKLLEQALDVLERSGQEDDPSYPRLLLLLGICRINLMQFSEAAELLERAFSLENLKSAPDQALLQDLYVLLTSAYLYIGRYEDVRGVVEEALEKFDLRCTQRHWLLLINLSQANLFIGRWEEARMQAQACLDGISSPYMRAFAAVSLAEVRLAQTAYLDAEEHLKYATAVFEELGEPSTRSEAMADLAETQLRAGKIDKAAQAARDALALMEAASTSFSKAQGLWTLAGVALAKGDYGEADSLLAASADIVHAKYSPRHPMHAELCFRRAELRVKQGLLAEGKVEFERGVSLLADGFSPDHPRIGQMKETWEDLITA
jgi:class 3 adenylate cyclase/DNA-binding winged helix-turn-helix (wHTH) protein/tetratricopeptide (TPR) repeat protein